MEGSYFPALLVLKSLRVICSVSGLLLILVLPGTLELEVGPHEPPRTFCSSGGILLFTRLTKGKCLKIFLIDTTSEKSVFFYLMALIKCSIGCTIYFVKVHQDCESNNRLSALEKLF